MALRDAGIDLSLLRLSHTNRKPEDDESRSCDPSRSTAVQQSLSAQSAATLAAAGKGDNSHFLFLLSPVSLVRPAVKPAQSGQPMRWSGTVS